MRAFIVLNPVAGRSDPEDVKRALDRHLGGRGWRCDIYETTGGERVGDLVRKQIEEGVEMVVAAGGDGTVSAVVDGVVHTGIPVGIIPSGSSNALAQELNIPLNVEKASRLLAGKPVRRTIDALQVGERFFVLAVGTGIDALTIQKTGRAEKRLLGPLAYVGSVPKAMIGMRPRRFTITADGHPIRIRATVVLLSNIGTLTRPLRWGPHIRPDDARIDIVVIRGRNLGDYLLAAWDMIPGPRGRARHIRYFSARHAIKVAVDPPLPVQGDGDLLGETPLEALVAPGAVNVLVPGEHLEPLGTLDR